LSDFPPLPYKTIVSLPPSSPGQNNSYIPRHIEHLFLTSYRSMPNTNVTQSIIQKTFGTEHYATDDFRRTRQFYELILVATKSIVITHAAGSHFNLALAK